MLELVGSGYVIEHCMSALRQLRKAERFRYYVADGLYALVTKEITYAKRLSELENPPVTEEESEKQKEQNKKEAERIRD